MPPVTEFSIFWDTLIYVQAMARIRNQFHFGLLDPDQFYEKDPDTDHSSKYLAQIMGNLQKINQNPMNIIFKKIHIHITVLLGAQKK